MRRAVDQLRFHLQAILVPMRPTLLAFQRRRPRRRGAGVEEGRAVTLPHGAVRENGVHELGG